MQAYKEHIQKCVRSYITLHPEEYARFRAALRIKQDKTSNRLAEIRGNEFVVRPLFELPETLYTAMQLILTEDELKWLWNDKDKKGARWFARTFKEFTVPDKV